MKQAEWRLQIDCMNREEIKKLSKELDLPIADIRKELKDYSDFCCAGVDIGYVKKGRGS